METRNITISAPGKLILHGEHAVVYGKKALAASLNVRTTLTLQHSQTGTIIVSLPNIDIYRVWNLQDIQDNLNDCCSDDGTIDIVQIFSFCKVTPDTVDTKQLAVVAFLLLFYTICGKDCVLSSVHIEVTSDLPAGAGLGSSAAYSTCLSAALLLHSKQISAPATETGDALCSPWTDKEQLELINNHAFQAEKVIHGRPSGIDNSISTHGGMIVFQDGQIIHVDRVPNLQVLLTDTQIPRSTKVLVAGVKRLVEKHAAIIEPLLDSIEAISNTCQELMAKSGSNFSTEEETTFKELMEMNQGLLTVLGVGHSRLDEIVQLTAKHGLTSKLTGAGGGGCAFTFIPKNTDPHTLETTQSELQSLGFKCWNTSMGCPGVMLHQCHI